MPHCVIPPLPTLPPTMSPRTLTATAATLAALPLALGALVWHGLQVRRQFWIEIDPFEIDLQLQDRNDV